MKILFTVETYYPKKDGVQMVTQYLAEGLASRGHDVTVFTSNIDENKNFETFHNVKIKRFDLRTKFGLYFGDRKKYIKDVLTKSKDIDVLINVCTQTAFTDLLLSHLSEINCKKILYMHGMYDFGWHLYNFSSFRDICNKIWKNIRWLPLYLKKSNFLYYDKVIQLHPLCVGYNFFVKRYNIVPFTLENAADSIFFNDVCIHESSDKDKYAICVSNFLPGKNQKFILKAFYKANCQNFGLVLIGSKKTNYYRQLIKLNNKLRKKYGNRDVKILTNQSRSITVKMIKSASMYLFASKHEVYPVSIIEAMASGIPYISTDVGCIRALPGGIVIKNMTEMINAINFLHDNLTSSKIIGKCGYQYAKVQLKVEEKVIQLEKLLNKIIK